MARDHSGYLSRVSMLYSVWGFIPTTWQLAITGAISAVTGYLGFQTGGLFYAILGGTAVFTMGTIAVFFLMLIFRNLGVFGKLTVAGIGVSGFGIEMRGIQVGTIRHLTLNVTLQNNTQRDVHFKIIRADLSVLGQVNPDSDTSKMINIILMGHPQSFLLATIDKISVPKLDLNTPNQINGKLKLAIKYGPSGTTLGYMVIWEADLVFGLVQQTEKGPSQYGLTVLPMIKVYEHRKVVASDEG